MVFIFLATGFEEIEAIATIDVIRRPGIDIQIVSTTGEKTVTGVHNIKVSADVLFEDADFSKAKMLILPGGMPGTTNLEKHEGLLALIRKHNQAGKWLAAICAAPSILGKMHLLRNLDATCYPGFEEFLDEAYVRTNQGVIVCNNIITSRGPGFAPEFGLKIAEILSSKEVADQVASDMLIK